MLNSTFDPNPQNTITPPANPGGSPGKTPVGSLDVVLPGKPPAAEGSLSVGPFAIALELMLDTWHGGYTPNNFESARISQTRLTREQAVALKLLALSLNKQNARMANGKFVQCSTDAVRYLLDQVAGQLPVELFKKLAE